MINHKKTIYFIFGIIILIFLGYNLTSELKNYIELDLNDEADYLILSKHIMSGGTRIVYPLWYKFLRIFESNDISLYYLNQRINIILLPICIYLLLFTYFRNIVFSLFFALLFLYSNTNVSTEYIVNDFVFSWAMKLNNFTLSIICLMACLIYYFKKKQYSTISLFTISFLILSYCRNEYCLLFIISIIIYAIYYILKLRNEKRETILFIFIILTSLILIKVFGLSITATEHSYLAYAQSYTRNYLQMKEMPLFPNIDLYTNSTKIFGNAKSISEFFFSNPIEFTKNSLFNIYNTVIINSYRITDILLPQIFVGYKDKSIINYMFSWIIIITLLINISQLKIKYLLRNPVILFLVICTIPTIIVFVVYIFEARYFLFFVPIIYISIIHLLINFRYKKITEFILIFIIGCIIILHPTTSTYFEKNKSYIDRRVINSINIINQYKEERKIKNLRILSNDGEFDKFIPNSSCENISINNMYTYNKKEPKLNFINYDVIILTENQEFSTQSLIYNNLIKFLKDNDSFIHIVDDKKSINLYLKKITNI